MIDAVRSEPLRLLITLLDVLMSTFVVEVAMTRNTETIFSSSLKQIIEERRWVIQIVWIYYNSYDHFSVG